MDLNRQRLGEPLITLDARLRRRLAHLGLVLRVDEDSRDTTDSRPPHRPELIRTPQQWQTSAPMVSTDNQWFAAGDTGNALDATMLGPALAQGFSIDYERVPQAIADLEHAAEFFKSRAVLAQRLATIPPPGVDGVSLNAVAQIGKWASDDGVNNLEATLKAGAMQLEDLARSCARI